VPRRSSFWPRLRWKQSRCLSSVLPHVNVRNEWIADFVNCCAPPRETASCPAPLTFFYSGAAFEPSVHRGNQLTAANYASPIDLYST
jgi:hypothetical protein